MGNQWESDKFYPGRWSDIVSDNKKLPELRSSPPEASDKTFPERKAWAAGEWIKTEFIQLFGQKELQDLAEDERDWLEAWYGQTGGEWVKTALEELKNVEEPYKPAVFGELRSTIAKTMEFEVNGFIQASEEMPPQEKEFIRENWKSIAGLNYLVLTICMWQARKDFEQAGKYIAMLKDDLPGLMKQEQKERKRIERGVVREIGLPIFYDLARYLAEKLGAEDDIGLAGAKFPDEFSELQKLLSMLKRADVIKLVNVAEREEAESSTKKGWARLKRLLNLE